MLGAEAKDPGTPGAAGPGTGGVGVGALVSGGAGATLGKFSGAGDAAED